MTDLSLADETVEVHGRARLVFVIGSGRCGSTLLGRILGQHGEFGFLTRLDEHLPLMLATSWPNHAFRILGAAPQPLQGPARQLQLRVQPSEGWKLLARRVSPEFAVSPRDLAAERTNSELIRRLRWFFDPLVARRGSPSFFQKFTGWPRAHLLRAAFPAAVFIHVVRDGRAVAGSLARMPWWSGHNGMDGWAYGDISSADKRAWEDSNKSPFVLAGIQWKLTVGAALDGRSAMPPWQWCDIRYEDLASRPEQTMDRILEFVGARGPSDHARLFRSFPIREARGYEELGIPEPTPRRSPTCSRRISRRMDTRCNPAATINGV